MIDFRAKNTASVAAVAAAKTERPKAEFWMNIGYSVETENEDGAVESTFVSLPMGLPLDDMKELAVNSSNERYAALQQARNSLYEQLMQACQNLKPGEEQIVNLEIQVRRVRGDQPTVSAGNNPFIRKLF